MSASDSKIVLGAGKIHGRQWTSLNAASQLAKIAAQISRRLRLPMIRLRLLGVDTIDLVLDFAADQLHQLGDRRAVEIPRVRQIDGDFPPDPPGVGVQHDDPVRQSNRLAYRVRDEEYGLARLHPQLLE